MEAQRLLAAATAWRKARGLLLPGAAIEVPDQGSMSARPQLDPAITESRSSTMTFEQALAHAKEQLADLLEST